MVQVEKIGGTSMSNMEAVLNNIVFFGNPPKLRNRVFVVSAYAGVTNALLENRKTGSPGIYTAFCERNNWQGMLSEVKGQLIRINESFSPLGLNLSEAADFLDKRFARVTHYLQNLSEVLASGYVPSENIFSAAREMLASIGEAHSAFNMQLLIRQRGATCYLADLGGFDDIQPLRIDERIQKAFRSIDTESGLVVATGYCKGTEGIMREFDRGYSDVTFSKIAVALNATQAIIHKEYHLSTADPEIVGVQNCKPIQLLNFDIADQLADIGMQAIHPKASKPLEVKGIDLRIKNTFQPEHPGTLISNQKKAGHPGVDLISGTEKVFIVEIVDPLMVGEVGFDERIMSLLNAFSISYIMKTTSANSISMVVFKKDVQPEFLDTLRKHFMEVRSQACALISILGMSLKKTGILAQAANLLAKENIAVLSIGMAYSQVNLQLVVEVEDFIPAIQTLHQGFFGVEKSIQRERANQA